MLTPEQQQSQAEWSDLTALDTALRAVGYELAVSLSTLDIIISDSECHRPALAAYPWEHFAQGGAAGRQAFAREVMRLVGGPDANP